MCGSVPRWRSYASRYAAASSVCWMLMVFTSLVAQVGVSTALRTMSDSIGAGMGIGFSVSAGENPISAEGGEPVLAYPRCDEDRLCDEDLGAGGWRTPGRAPAGVPIGLRSGHAGQRAGHHRFLIVRGIPERPVPPGAGPPYLWRRRQCAGPPRLRAAGTVYRSARHSVSGRRGATPRCVWPGSSPATCRPKAPALGHFREPHLFG